MTGGLSPEAVGMTICEAFDRLIADPLLRRAARPADFDGLVERLYGQLIEPERELGVRGLLWVLSHDPQFTHQNIAGEILMRFLLPCAMPLDQLLDELLPVFNASSSKTVDYLVHCFGREAVRRAVHARRRGPRVKLTPQLDAMSYWLGDHPDDPEHQWQPA